MKFLAKGINFGISAREIFVISSVLCGVLVTIMLCWLQHTQILTEFDEASPVPIRCNYKIEKASESWGQHMLAEDWLQLVKNKGVFIFFLCVHKTSGCFKFICCFQKSLKIYSLIQKDYIYFIPTKEKLHSCIWKVGCQTNYRVI